MRPSDLGLARLLATFALLAAVLLGLLAIAPARERFTEWREVQQRYNSVAVRAGKPPIEIGIREIRRPDLGVVDRCVTCHLGAGRSHPLEGDPLFQSHPPIPHDPEQIGCTICHAGEGRATSRHDAHGQGPSDHPLIPRLHREAGCGVCHSHVLVAADEQLSLGRAVYRRSGCPRCHERHPASVAGPDLSAVGLRYGWTGWQDRHLQAASEASEGPWTTVFEPVSDSEIGAVDAYLASRVGTPRLMDGKVLFHRLGCRGCHRINGVGGDDGPDLSDFGDERVEDLDFSHLPDAHTIADWVREQLVDPRAVAPDGRMPDLGLRREQAELLTTYLLSLRERDLPARWWPQDRERGVRAGGRDFSTDGESLFGVFCIGCHGPQGGSRSLGDDPKYLFAPIGGAALLTIADDRFLRETVMQGRPTGRMPAWGTMRGGLARPEIDAVVGYLRSLEPTVPTSSAVLSAPLDPEVGRAVFERDCTACHGEGGRGTAVGPPLAAPDEALVGRDEAIYSTVVHGIEDTAMRPFRGFDTSTMHSLVAVVGSLPPVNVSRASWAPRRGLPARGERVFRDRCAGCHAEERDGSLAPELLDSGFRAAATEGYVIATVLRTHNWRTPGDEALRAGDGHPIEPADVADVAAYVCSSHLDSPPLR